MLHAIGFAPEACLGDDFMGATWDDVAVALHVSTYSLKALADAFVPLMTDGGAFVGLDFDNTRRLAGVQLDGRGQVGAARASTATSPRSSARRASAATSSPPAR